MLLYFMRHGAAEPGIGSPDAARRLTREGQEEVRRAARGLARAGIAFGAVFTSPLVRARRTAEIVLSEQPAAADLKVADWLAPGATIEDVLSHLKIPALSPSGILIVGHEPDMSTIAVRLVSGDPGRSLRFEPGTIACITLDAVPPTRPASLEWILTARLAASLGSKPSL